MASVASATSVGTGARGGQAGTKRKTSASTDTKSANDTTTSRRQKENQTYIEMAESLPLDPKDTKDLDRASVLRVTINYVKFRDMIAENERHNPQQGRHQKQLVAKVKGIDSLMSDTFKALDGFILVISGDGSMSYVSDNISNHLGLKQVDVIGHNIRDLVHPQDFMEVAHIFSDHEPMVKPDLEEVLLQSRQKHFVVRMRSTFSASVRSITRCASFKPMYCSAQVTYRPSTQPMNPYKREVAQVTVLCRVAGLVDVKDMCLGVCVMSKHDMTYNCRFVDNKMRIILGYDPADMINSNALAFFHPGDLSDQHQMEAHMQVVTTGQSKSPAFRVLTKWGNWVWVRSVKQCTYDPSTQAPTGLVIYTWLIGPSDAIECNRAFIQHYGSDHLPNAPQQFSDVLGSDFNPNDVQNSMYLPLHATPRMPPATAATVTPKAEPVDVQFHHLSCPPGHAPCDDRGIPQAMVYPSQPEQVFTSSPPITPPINAPMFQNIEQTVQYQPVQTGPMQSVSSIASPHEGYPIGYMTPSPSGSESNSHSHFSPHGTHTEDRPFMSPSMHSYGYHASQEGFPLSTNSRSSYGSQGHLPQMVSMATQPRASVEDDGYATEVFTSPTSILPSEVLPCAEGLPADLSTMCTIYFNPNSAAYPMATGQPGSYQQPPLYCQPIHETH